jgi:uncharacterized delta-60 repeat protein
VVLRLAVAALAAGSMGMAASPAAAVERPGSLQWSLHHFAGHEIAGLDTAPDGRIVVAGLSAYTASTRYTWVHAYLPDGTRDASFGEGGIVDFPGDRRYVVGALAQPDGGVLVAENGSRFYPPDTHLVRRLTADGRPDATFGDGGSIQPDFGGEESHLSDIALQPDGRVVVTGIRGDDAVVVARYLPDGSPDASFGSRGVVTLASAEPAGLELAIQPDGGLLVATSGRGALLIARLSPDGKLDESFGQGGLAPVEYANPSLATDAPVYGRVPPIVVSDGRIRLAVAFTVTGEQAPRMALVGLTKNGHPDMTFGLRGLALGPPPQLPVYDEYVETIGGESIDQAVMDRRGSIIVAGDLWAGDFHLDDHAVIRRFLPNGSLDRSFGDAGAVNGAPPWVGYNSISQRIALVGEDRLVVSEYAANVKYGSPNIASLRALDAGYDNDPPRISIKPGCRWIRVRIRDLSALELAVVRSGRRVLRRTRYTSFRMRPPSRRARISVEATDFADNSSTKTVRLERCPA